VGDQGSAREIELASSRQYVNHCSGHQQRSRALGGEGVGDEVLSVNHGDRTSADDFELGFIVDDGSRVLVHAQAEQRWLLGDKREEPSVAVALFEMLVNYHTAKQAEAGGELAHPLLGGSAAGTERDHVLSQDAGTC
jgi:hypothetical protein